MYSQMHDKDAPKMATVAETRFSCCSPCLDNGRNTVARHYCVDCEIYVCTKCVKRHSLNSAMRKHLVNDANPSDSSGVDDDTTSLQSDVPCESAHSLRCTQHQGKPIDTHCKDHDEICCGERLDIERGIQFCFDQAFEKPVLEMKSIGRLDDHIYSEYQESYDVKEFQARFHSKVDVKQSHDSDTQLFDVCLMDTNDLLLADYGNKKLKQFDSNLQFKDEISLSGHPVAVCKTGSQEIAVRIQDTKVIHFVSVRQSMQRTSSFTLANDGFGMAYDTSTGEIFACEENKVSVYSKTGNKLGTYDKKRNGKHMFSNCRQIALSLDRQYVYVTDYLKGLFILNKSGTLKMKVSLPGAFSLCLLPGQIILTGSYKSGVIFQIDKDGKHIGNLIDTKDGRHLTYCAIYNHDQSRLIVGGYPSVLSVYTLSPK